MTELIYLSTILYAAYAIDSIVGNLPVNMLVISLSLLFLTTL